MTSTRKTTARTWAGIDWAAIDWGCVDWASAAPRLATGRPSAWAELPTRGGRRRGGATVQEDGTCTACGTTLTEPQHQTRPRPTAQAAGDVVDTDVLDTDLAETEGAAVTWTQDTDWSATDWSTWSAPARTYPVTVYGIHEATPGPRWKALCDATWPAYRSWYLTGPGTRPSLAEAQGKLEKYMPELVPVWRELVAQTGGDDDAARFLTMWNLPAFAPACSQLATVGEETSLTRNYDYVPDLWEATVYSSEFTGRKVIGTGDCLWGLLDGMNDAGLAVSLTFGGRPGSGPGFAIPLVIRYLLEVAETAAHARELLRGLPVSMSYNITVVDVSGERFTAFVAPGQDVEFFDACTATNHRGKTPEYPEKAAQFHSVERLEFLDEVSEKGVSAAEARDGFLRDPLHQDHYSAGFGTLFTAHYRPDLGTVEYVWPGVSWTRRFDDADDTLDIVLEGR